jgi:hypothetical protein
MKIKIAYWLANGLYKLGDKIHLYITDRNVWLLWKLYKLCMLTSLKIQLWAGLEKPWERPNH